MSDTTVNGSTSTTAASSQSTTVNANSTLSKDDFLKLLVAQLTNQDPTAPMDSGQFVTQMAQFTSLEQTQNMSSAIDQLVATQSDNSLSDKATMIGKKITWTESSTDENGNDISTTMNGIVNAVNVKDGQISYLTDSGKTVDPSTITEVSDSAGSTDG
ncbi:flagellar hook assembly protein FlgD [Sporolactobacillus shoreae]|uniref:Flagellar hook assembly protein FlgD n=1 Tax=Sporolactobacillus shoreae TaxID=1465501 RepID=A0A4Z0GU69_9BACL|nr:flagellar hook capping FlgD N-terminal domain-containing protein [Sporolactobacillus shoreae]TGB00285.1 flagellar hook assembly protein FlgD [Sporolactobacillus shoreae]